MPLAGPKVNSEQWASEGAVKLGYKQELEAAVDDKQREQLYNTLLEDMYERGKALETASFLEIDTVIDPVNTRQLIASTLASSQFRRAYWAISYGTTEGLQESALLSPYFPVLRHSNHRY